MSNLRGDEPRVAGRFLTAREILRGTAHLAWIGDSITSFFQSHMLRRITPDRWKGFTLYGDGMLGSSSYDGVTMTMHAAGRGQSSEVLSDVGYSCIGTAETIFTGSQLFPAEVAAFSNRLYEFSNDNFIGALRANYVRDRVDLFDDGFNIRVVGIGSTAGMVNKTRFKLRDDSNNVILVGGAIDFRTPGNGNRFTLDYTGLPALGPSAALQAGLFGIPGQTAAIGETSIIEAVRYERDGEGLTLTMLGFGASNIEQWDSDSSPLLISASAYGLLASLEVTHVMIMLTNNDPNGLSYDDFKTHTESVMAKIKAQIPDVQFILATQYDTNTTQTHPDHRDVFSTVYYDLSQSRDDVLYLNLYAAEDCWATLNADGLLTDQIHPTDEGKYAFLATLQGLLETAAILAPTAPEVNSTFGTSTVQFTWKPNGTATDVTSAVLRDKDGLFGVVRTDTGDVVVAADTELDHDTDGHYFLTFNNPAADLVYRFAVTMVDERGNDQYFESYSDSRANVTVAEIIAGLTASVPFEVISSVLPNFLDLFRGDAYLISQGGRELGFTMKAGEPWPDLISTAKFYCLPSSQLLDDAPAAVGLSAISCTVAVASGDGRKVILELSEANTTLLVPGMYDWWIVANDGGDDATIRSGTMRIRKRH